MTFNYGGDIVVASGTQFGIGGTASCELEVQSATTPFIKVTDTSTPTTLSMLCDDSTGIIRTETSHDLIFGTAQVERYRLTVAGDIDVSTTTDTSSGTTGSIHTDGGVGIAKKLYVGGQLSIADDIVPIEFASQGIRNISGGAGVSYADTETVTMDMNGGLLFTVIDENTGSSACFFANYNSATITEISDPNTAFDVNTATDNGLINVFKSANSQTISVVNNTTASHAILIHTLGQITSATGPA